MSELAAVMQAAEFAARVHAGQRRKGGRVPYVNHVIEVGRLVAEDGRGAQAVIAALLHDVVEDSDVRLSEIEVRFGKGVARLVDALTDRPEWEALARPHRKALQAEHIAHAPAEAKAIKIADQTSNVRDVLRLPGGWPPSEAAAYVAGTGQVVAVCRSAAPDLAAIYDHAVANALEALTEGDG